MRDRRRGRDDGRERPLHAAARCTQRRQAPFRNAGVLMGASPVPTRDTVEPDYPASSANTTKPSNSNATNQLSPATCQRAFGSVDAPVDSDEQYARLPDRSGHRQRSRLRPQDHVRNRSAWRVRHVNDGAERLIETETVGVLAHDTISTGVTAARPDFGMD